MIGEATNSIPNPNLMGLSTNLANQNKWFAYLPLENVLGVKYKNLDLHLSEFSIPQLEMGSMSVSYKGYSKLIPTKIVNPDTKELTLTYFVDSGWTNYKSIYAWMSCIEGNINPVTDDNQKTITPEIYIPLRIYLLDSYKKKIVQFLYEDCWIKVFNDISLRSSDSGEVQHSFTLAYDKFKIEDI